MRNWFIPIAISAWCCVGAHAAPPAKVEIDYDVLRNGSAMAEVVDRFQDDGKTYRVVEEVHGCSVHFVSEQLDHGPIIVQAAVPVRQGDTPDLLAARVLRQEHAVYPRAVRWFLDGKLVVCDCVVNVKGNDAQLVYSDRD